MPRASHSSSPVSPVSPLIGGSIDDGVVEARPLVLPAQSDDGSDDQGRDQGGDPGDQVVDPSGDPGDQGGDTPQPEPTPETPSSDPVFSTEEWVLLILLGVGVVAIIIGATSAATSRAEANASRRQELGRRLREITSGCRWISGRAATDVLVATTADQLRLSWGTARAHMVDLEGKIAVVAGATGDRSLDSSLSTLGESLAGLRGALESNVALRLRPDAMEQGAAIQASTEIVTRCRHQVDNAVVPVLAAQR